MTTEPMNRRYELDWLRVLATLLVFLYHSSRFFNQNDWVVKNIDTYVWVEMWAVFAMTWLMPLFFVISGMSLFYAIGKSGGWRTFYTGKFQRLMIPVLVGSVTHVAIQVYLERVTHGQFSGSFFSFLPYYFNGLYRGIGIEGGNFCFIGMHLWYLLFLFIDSIICYHLFVWLKGSGRVFLDRMTNILAMPILIIVWLSIPLFLMKQIIPAAILNFGAGSWGFIYYIWYLIAGFIMMSSERIQKIIKNQCWIFLSLGMILSSATLFSLFGPPHMVPPARIDHWAHSLIYFFSAWCWILAILGFGMRFLAFDRPFLQTANEGVLPFYILHQSVLTGVGFFVMQWKIHDFLKWAIVFTGSFLMILALYNLLVRKFDLLRFLFGMKTSHPHGYPLGKKWALISMHALYVGLIVFAISGAPINRTPMPLRFDPAKDILLDSRSITARSPNGVEVVDDPKASIGKAIEFSAGANIRAKSHPKVYVEMRFSAPAGLYTIWLRGKSDLDDGTDSVWFQVDSWIGARAGGLCLGNWRDIHPAGIYAWAGNVDTPSKIELKHSGDHRIRIQPRQTPHRIDQIWLSRDQRRIPDTFQPITP